MRHAAISSFLQLTSIGIVAGCAYPSLPKVPTETVEFPVTVNRDLDLLFLIDDSPSMGDKQTNLATNFPTFMKVLSSIPGGLPNVHIGVVTSDLGTQGAADTNPSFGPGIGQLGMGGCSGVGKDGNLQLFGAAGMVGGDLFISNTADPVTGVRTRNYSVPGGTDPEARLEEIFGQMAHAGAGGCGFEQHLEAIKHALVPSNAVNMAFVRPNANLGVIIVADEDDCSLAHYSLVGPEDSILGPQQSFRCTRFGVLCDQHGQTSDEMNQPGPKDKCHPDDDSKYLTRVGDYAAFLKGLKLDPAKIVVAGIAGTTAPVATELRSPPGNPTGIPALAHSCTYVGAAGHPEVADPAIRIKFLLDQFANRNAFASICEQDLSGALEQIGDLLKTAMGIPCFEGSLADVDLKAPDTQYSCAVTVVTSQNTMAGLALPRCLPESPAANNKPCWHVASDATSCPNGNHLTPVIEGRDSLASDRYVIASCALEPAM